MDEPKILDGIWQKGGTRVSAVLFEGRAGRLLVTGLEPRDEADVPSFVRTLIHIGSQCSSFIRGYPIKELWAVFVERPHLAEFVELSGQDLAAASVDWMAIVDNDAGYPVRILNGRPHAARLTPYRNVALPSPAMCVKGGVQLPHGIARLCYRDLKPHMRLIFDTAIELYGERLLSAVCFLDRGARLMLTVRADLPEGALTLLVDLDVLANEISKGLNLEAVKQTLNALRPS